MQLQHLFPILILAIAALPACATPPAMRTPATGESFADISGDGGIETEQRAALCR